MATMPWPRTVAKHRDPQVQAEIDADFRDILQSRALSDWDRASDLNCAARLARAWWECRVLTAQIEEEGFTTLSSKGVVMPNPALTARATVEAQVTACMRALSMVGSATDARVLRQSGKVQTQAKAALDRAKHPLLYGHDDDANSLLA
jgi:hypothetical protein